MTMEGLRNCLTLIVGYLAISAVAQDMPSSCPQIVSRSEWGARPSNAITYMPFPVGRAIIIHTATPQCTSADQCSSRVRNIQTFQTSERNYDDIAYSFLIGGDGRIYEGVGWHKVGAHTRGYNSRSLGIAFIGNFDEVLPSEDMLSALRKLLDCAVQAGELKSDYKLLAHRQVSATVSPGMAFFEALKSWPHWASSP